MCEVWWAHQFSSILGSSALIPDNNHAVVMTSSSSAQEGNLVPAEGLVLVTLLLFSNPLSSQRRCWNNTTLTHVAGAAVIPLQNWREKMLAFFESLSYTSLEIGLKRIFQWYCCALFKIAFWKTKVIYLLFEKQICKRTSKSTNGPNDTMT